MCNLRKTMAMLVALLLLVLVVDVQATYYARGAAVGDPDNYAIYGHSVGVDVPYSTVTANSVRYQENFVGIGYEEFGNTVHAIKGSEIGSGDPCCYVDNFGSGIGIGRTTPANSAYWLRGIVVWHIQAPAGQVFDAGTASVLAYAEGFWWEKATEKYSLRLVDQRPVFSRSGYTVPVGATDIITGFTYYNGDGSHGGSFDETISIDIPSGTSEFWLIFENSYPELLDDVAGSCNATAYLKNIDIDATTVPEPMTLVLLGLGGLGLLRRRK